MVVATVGYRPFSGHLREKEREKGKGGKKRKRGKMRSRSVIRGNVIDITTFKIKVKVITWKAHIKAQSVPELVKRVLLPLKYCNCDVTLSPH